jgi:hypothetical protein
MFFSFSFLIPLSFPVPVCLIRECSLSCLEQFLSSGVPPRSCLYGRVSLSPTPTPGYLSVHAETLVLSLDEERFPLAEDITLYIFPASKLTT